MGQITKAAEAANTPATLTPKQAITKLVTDNRSAIGMSLPRAMDADRFSRLLLTACNTNPDLLACDPRSFLAAGVSAAQLGLEPNDARGLAYLIPFKERGVSKVQLIIGYRGMMDLARRSGMVSSINAFPVYEGDHFRYELGLNPTIEHVPNPDGDEDPAKLTHVYAVAKVNGDPQFVVLSRKQVDRTRASSRGAASNYSPWASHYVEMAIKTAIRRLCKMLPQTVEMAQAIEHDERPLVLSDLGQPAPDHDAIEVSYDRQVDTESGEILTPEVMS
jgi:recombination protein RecT